MIFGEKIKELREQNGLLQRQVAAALEIDSPMYSRLERGEKRAKEEQVKKLAEFYHVSYEELRKIWLADKIYEVLADEDSLDDILQYVSDSFTEYHTKAKKQSE